MNMNSKSKGLKPESRAARGKHQPRFLGKWSGEHQPHQSAPMRIGRRLRAPSRVKESKPAVSSDATGRPDDE